MMAYEWPGNVRQLENSIERAIVLAQGQLIGPEHIHLTETSPTLEQDLVEVMRRFVQRGEGLEAMIGDLRRRLIAAALDIHHGNRAAAAKALRVSEDDLV
jgi:DNA-binding NtrC family response regulator